jgi:hypothetical protein
MRKKYLLSRFRYGEVGEFGRSEKKNHYSNRISSLHVKKA